MKIYIIWEHEDYGGDIIISIHKSREKALEALKIFTEKDKSYKKVREDHYTGVVTFLKIEEQQVYE